MKRKHVGSILLLMVLFGRVPSVAFAGMWGIVTLTEFPDYAVAGAPLTLTFAVRAEPRTDGLRPGPNPNVKAKTASGLATVSKVVTDKGRGEYRAVLTFPQAGEWTITIDSGFNSQLTLPPLIVIAPGTSAPIPFAPATRGVRLFSSKGCVICHRHIEVNPEFSPSLSELDLTGNRLPVDDLRKFLADPGAKPMPNLKLSNDEIEALLMFIDKLAVKKEAIRGGAR